MDMYRAGKLASDLMLEMRKVRRVAETTEQSCKRKTVCSEACITSGPKIGLRSLFNFVNGPNAGHQCSGVIGECGCAHSEPRLTMRLIKDHWERQIILMITHSPCSLCANVIVDSGIYDLVVYGELTEHDKRGVDILKRACTVLSYEDIKLAQQIWSEEGVAGSSGESLRGNLQREAAREVYDQLTEWETRRNRQRSPHQIRGS